MRALLVAAAVILSVTAARAEGPTQRAIPPAAVTPSATIVEQLRAAGELKDPKVLEAPAAKVDAVESRPVEAKPAETQPVVAKPADVKPVEAKPAEPKAVEAKPAESKPVQAADAKPAKPRVVRKRESDEHKARRIAAKYGVYW